MNTWTFDKSVADNFEEHAKKHIPNYLKVIEKALSVCQRYPTNSKIIDVGAAVGTTLRTLNRQGFDNLYGVDNSQDMLDKIDTDIAKLICKDKFPVEEAPFDIVIANWTLHFIKDKTEYLKDIYKSLNPGGALILSEKTSTDQLPTDFYYDYKRQQGVSEQEILDKANSLIGKMFVENPQWYINILSELSFKQIYIIDADWCFTSFLAIK